MNRIKWANIKTGVVLAGGLVLAGHLPAHNVIWWENPVGSAPTNTLAFTGDEFYGYVKVVPSFREPCTVVVNLTPPSSTLISAQVLAPNPANAVSIRVVVLRAPANHFETATVSGEWHATGFPVGYGCDATNPNPFSVPISVSDQPPKFQIGLSANKQWVVLNPGFDSALLEGSCLTGPWRNIAVGSAFDLPLSMPVKFFQRSKQIGNQVGGTVTDSGGNLLSGIQLQLPYGGLGTISDLTGTYNFPWMPYGLNAITITNPSGSSLNVEITNTDNTTVNFQVALQAAPPVPVTNACNCTPWCAIGFGALPGGQTPVYYAGGANPPPSGPANCGQPVVTVTPPTGAPFTITPGSNHHHNSGPNPASGTWTVTATVCGQTKVATVDVP